jgi:hypothetical protein
MKLNLSLIFTNLFFLQNFRHILSDLSYDILSMVIKLTINNDKKSSDLKNSIISPKSDSLFLKSMLISLNFILTLNWIICSETGKKSL